MKKLNYLLLGAAGLLLASCSQEEVFTPSNGDTANITIALSTPKLQTRYGDGKSATKLQYALYETIEGEDTYLYDKPYEDEFVTSANITISLATDHAYKVVFWAANEEAPYEVDFENGNKMTVNYDGAQANDDNLDAFYGVLEIDEVKGDAQLSISLTRPFAQINVGTNDYDEAEEIGITPTKTSIKVTDVATELNLLTGEVSGEEDVTFAENVIDRVTNEYPKDDYEYLAMTYVLVGEGSSNHDVTYSFNEKEGGKVKGRTVTNVPLQRNHRTNLYGSLLTSDQNITVDKDNWDEEDNDQNLTEKPEDGLDYNDETKTLTASNVASLKWLSDVTNDPLTRADAEVSDYLQEILDKKSGTMDNGAAYFAKIEIEEGVYDLSGISDWRPIKLAKGGDARGSLKGQGTGVVIKNLNVTAENDAYASFVNAFSSDVENITIQDAVIKGNYKAAALASEGEAAVIKNCHVKGATITSTPYYKDDKDDGLGYNDANNVGAILGFGPSATIENCTVEGVTVSGFRKVGGIVGYGASAKLTGNTIKNSFVIADMTNDEYAKYNERKPEAGKIFGTAPATDDNNVAENVTIDVKITAKASLATIVKELRDGTNLHLGEGQFSTEKISYPTNINIAITGEGADKTTYTIIGNPAMSGCDVVFNNLTIATDPMSGTNIGIAHLNTAIYNKVTFKGETKHFGNEETFNECIFEVNPAINEWYDKYSIWTYASSKVTFNKCTFNNVRGKAILVYHESGNHEFDIEVNDCKFNVAQFNGQGPIKEDKKGAFEVHTELFKENVKGTFRLNNCSFEGDSEQYYGKGLWNECENTYKTPTTLFTFVVDGEVKQTGTGI